MILHLVSKAEWDASPAAQPYRPVTFAKDGFIHCSASKAMLLEAANRFYASIPGEFVVLEIDEAKVTSQVKWEEPIDPTPETPDAQTVPLPPEVDAERGGELDTPVSPAASPLAATPARFPHIYGPLNRDAIIDVKPMMRASGGTFIDIGPVTGAAHTPAQQAPPAGTAAGDAGDKDNPLNLKTPSQMADELLSATDEFSESLKRFKDRIEGRMAEIDEKIKKL